MKISYDLEQIKSRSVRNILFNYSSIRRIFLNPDPFFWISRLLWSTEVIEPRAIEIHASVHDRNVDIQIHWTHGPRGPPQTSSTHRGYENRDLVMNPAASYDPTSMNVWYGSRCARRTVRWRRKSWKEIRECPHRREMCIGLPEWAQKQRGPHLDKMDDNRHFDSGGTQPLPRNACKETSGMHSP